MAAARKPSLHECLDAYRRFEELSSDDRLRAIVAFGAFLEALDKYANGEPDAAKVRKYFDLALSQFPQTFFSDADGILADFGNNLIAKTRPAIERAVLTRDKFRWRGAVESIAGAFLWTVLLIVFSFVLVWTKPDIIQALRTTTSIIESPGTAQGSPPALPQKRVP